MITLGGLVFFMAVSALIGKHTRRMNVVSYILIAIIAAIQVGMVLYDIYSMQAPAAH